LLTHPHHLLQVREILRSLSRPEPGSKKFKLQAKMLHFTSGRCSMQ
jgi:hypothetical protein